MSASESKAAVVLALAEEFLERYRCGEGTVQSFSHISRGGPACGPRAVEARPQHVGGPLPPSHYDASASGGRGDAFECQVDVAVAGGRERPVQVAIDPTTATSCRPAAVAWGGWTAGPGSGSASPGRPGRGRRSPGEALRQGGRGGRGAAPGAQGRAAARRRLRLRLPAGAGPLRRRRRPGVQKEARRR